MKLQKYMYLKYLFHFMKVFNSKHVKSSFLCDGFNISCEKSANYSLILLFNNLITMIQRS